MSIDWEKVLAFISPQLYIAKKVAEDPQKFAQDFMNLANNIKESVVNYVAQFSSTYFNTVISTYERFLNNVKENKIEDAYREIAPLMTVSFLTTIGLDFLQTKVAGSGIDLKATSDKLVKLLSADNILVNTVYTIISEKIATYMNRYVSSKVQDYLLPPELLIRAYLKGYIDRLKLNRYLQQYGIPLWAQEILIDFNDFTPSVFQIERILRYTDPGKTKILSWLKENGVTQDELDFWINYFSQVLIKDEYDRHYTKVLDKYVEGLISDGDFEAYVIKWKRTSEEREAILFIAKALKSAYIRELSAKKHIELFKKDLYTCEELHKKLAEVYRDPEVAQAVTELECARRGIVYG